MVIDINNSQNKRSDGGTNRPCQESPTMSLVRRVVSSCKAMSSYEAACAMMVEMMPVAACDTEALQELLRGKEEVRNFFEQRNTPQPSTQFEGCNVFMKETPDGRFVAQDVNMAIDVNSPGNMIANNITRIKKEENEGEYERE